MPSRTSRGRGQGMHIHYGIVDTSLGSMLLATTDKGVCRLSFGETLADLTEKFPGARIEEGGGSFDKVRARVLAVIENGAPAQSIATDTAGTPFQEAVWAQLRAIPAGETRSYRDIAAQLGNPGATRAVGGANGANGVAVLIPCHRVVAAGGKIGGYAYGPRIKRELLRREQAGERIADLFVD